ncbi:MAG TPA: sodium:solute symporter, partial [Chroococcales cyanobacterium]
MPVDSGSLFIDLTVVLGYFTAIVLVGLHFGKREADMESFVLGGRSIPWWAVLASIIAAETSAATFLGTPGEGYKLANYSYLQIVIGMIIGRIVIAYLFLKPFFDLNVFSIYEYLEVRFGPKTRQAAALTFAVTRVLASGARLYVGAIVLVVGLKLLAGMRLSNEQELLVYISSIVLTTLVTAVYTSIGGIKAVVWTDCIQCAVMIGGALAAIAILLGQMPGGFGFVADFYNHADLAWVTTGITGGGALGDNVLKVLTSDYTIWAALVGMSFTTLATHGTDQDMVQRMLTAPDYKKSRQSLILSGLADAPIWLIFLTIGILLHLFYQQSHDANLPAKTNEVFAYFILSRMPVGLRGLLIAGIFATTMGSLSAALNALATSATRDWYPMLCGGKEPSEPVKVVKLFTYVFAVLLILVAAGTSYFVIVNPESRIIPIVLGIMGYTYGSLLGVFLLGL